MKKLICLLTAIVMLAGLCACGAKQPAQEEAEDWTREGFFGDESGNMLSITWMDLDDSAGWYAGLMLGDDIESSYGNMLRQEGNSLRGNIVPDYEEGEMIVTITEEGEDGLSLTVEGGETYHFTPMDLNEADISVSINTDGIGQFSYVEEAQESDGDALWTSVQLSVFEPETIVMRAVATEADWPFVKWTMNGEDYSTDEEITVEITESAEFVAVFEWTPEAEDTDYYSSVTAMGKEEVEALSAFLREAYLAADWEAIADYIRFPVTVSGTEINSADEFLAFMQDKTVSDSDRSALQDESCHDMFFNGIGICLGSGQIWLCDPNYLTEEPPVLEIIGLNGIVDR